MKNNDLMERTHDNRTKWWTARGGGLLIVVVSIDRLLSSAKLGAVQSELEAVTLQASQQRTLIESLEQDLLRVNALERQEAEGAPADDGDSETQPTAELLSRAVNFTEGLPSLPTSELKIGSSDSNLLSIVASQRERFRVRVHELEAQNIQQQQQLGELQLELDQSRADNVKLYGKIKFLQSYQGRKGGQVSVPADDIENRYSGEYERHLDPFKTFNLQEKQRKYGQLRTHDKATLGIGRWIMSSSQTRAIFFFYLVFLHLLVFTVLYRVAYTESCKRDFATDCVSKFQEHMHQVHGQQGGPHG
uniref:Protein CASP n=1 Tax=Plectus sambesii TaxID=2011161 RepID=A0A914V7Q1_9BILA